MLNLNELQDIVIEVNQESIHDWTLTIDEAIKNEAFQFSRFSVQFVFNSTYLSEYRLSPQVYELLSIYSNRGFQTKIINLNDTVSNFLISWSHPESNINVKKTVYAPSPERILELGNHFTAWSVYYNQTGGVDARKFSFKFLNNQIEKLIVDASINGKTQVLWRGPEFIFARMPVNAVKELFSELLNKYSEYNIQVLPEEGLFLDWSPGV